MYRLTKIRLIEGSSISRLVWVGGETCAFGIARLTETPVGTQPNNP